MSTAMTPALFTYNALSLIGERLASAASPGDFLAEVDVIVKDPGNVLRVPGMASFAVPLDASDDGANSQLVFETLGQMDRANAADARLWSYLALITQREYMTGRWSLDGVSNWKARAADRWLMSRPTRRALVHNGVARLWWVADLSCDPQLERPKSAVTADPYAYTKWVFANEDRVQAIFERELGASPVVMWAVIEALQGSSAASQSAEVQAVAKEIRLHSGFRSLESLGEEGVTALIRAMTTPAAE